MANNVDKRSSHTGCMGNLLQDILGSDKTYHIAWKIIDQRCRSQGARWSVQIIIYEETISRI